MLGWTFQNTGETAWPLDILFLRANGDEIESSPWHATHSLAVNDQVTILVEFTAPSKPGKYFACFRLTQGDTTTFGDKVFLNLPPDPIEVQQGRWTKPAAKGGAKASRARSRARAALEGLRAS